MSFLFALLQLASFASIDGDNDVVARDMRAERIQLSTPSPDLSRPIVNPCAGTSCR